MVVLYKFPSESCQKFKQKGSVFYSLKLNIFQNFYKKNLIDCPELSIPAYFHIYLQENAGYGFRKTFLLFEPGQIKFPQFPKLK